MIIRIFHYLNGTRNIGLRFSELGDELERYLDFILTNCITKCRYIIRLFGETISYKRKYTYVSMSTCETEYVTINYAFRPVAAFLTSLI